AHTAADGSYTLRVPLAPRYDCTASAPPRYLPISYAFSLFTGLRVTLNFRYETQTSCAATTSAATIECPLLALRTAQLAGAITFAGSGKPAAHVTVECVSADVPAPSYGQSLQGATTQSTAQGTYTLGDLAIGRYTCVAGNDFTAQHGVVPDTGNGRLSFQICQTRCARVRPHGGPVIHQMTAYLIFWLPANAVYDGNGDPATYEALMQRYIQDVGGTAYYGVLGQYWDAQGPIQNQVTLGGTYTDTQGYGVPADQSQPLLDSDIQTEVSDAMRVNRWSAGVDHVFFVFTAYGAEWCSTASLIFCSFPRPTSGDNVACGYHNDMAGATTPVVYAEIIDSAECVGGLNDSPTSGPNGDSIADLQIQTLAHEQIEAASDPLLNGWYSDDQGNQIEVADLCEMRAGSTTLNHGNVYTLQPTWSNLAGICAFGG
ncbi:MAG TPA: hypothetical protein VGN32_04440, partial [Ktedonobacterales bacterium]|nr:hypothetical protein [Ktedonobacterales bacterium]